jgi:hypothetical protein
LTQPHHSMPALLPELLRWQRPLGPPGPSGRWTNWALEIMARHGRLESRTPRSRMELGLPPSPVIVERTRWEMFTASLAPRIELSIDAVLHRWIVDERRYSSVDAGRRHLHTREMVVQSSETPRTSLAASGDQAAKTGAVTLGLQSVEAAAPISRAVYRAIEETANEPRSRTLVLDEVRSIHLRIMEERQRIEVRPQIVWQEARTSIAVAVQAEVAATREASRATGNGNGHRPGNGAFDVPLSTLSAPSPIPGQPAAVNIDQVTEQVIRRLDDRLIAHRERMGKLS